MNAEQRLARKQREDRALNRVLLWFGGAVILEFFLLLLNRFGTHTAGILTTMKRGVTHALWIVGGVCLVLAVVCVLLWVAARRRKGKTFFPGLGAISFGSLALCAAVAAIWKEIGIQFLYVCVPVVAVLALVYYLYQREFFLVALQGGLVLFAMWTYRKLYLDRALVYGVFAAVAALTVAFLVFTWVLQKHKGRLGKVRVLSKRAGYLPIYLAGAFTLVCLAVTLALGATAAYVCIIATVAGLFGVAVYYTVRLM